MIRTKSLENIWHHFGLLLPKESFPQLLRIGYKSLELPNSFPQDSPNTWFYHWTASLNIFDSNSGWTKLSLMRQGELGSFTNSYSLNLGPKISTCLNPDLDTRKCPSKSATTCKGGTNHPQALAIFGLPVQPFLEVSIFSGEPLSGVPEGLVVDDW